MSLLDDGRNLYEEFLRARRVLWKKSKERIRIIYDDKKITVAERDRRHDAAMARYDTQVEKLKQRLFADLSKAHGTKEPK